MSEASDQFLRSRIDHLTRHRDQYRERLKDIVDQLYGQGYDLVGHHPKGDKEPLDVWFEDNGWLEEIE